MPSAPRLRPVYLRVRRLAGRPLPRFDPDAVSARRSRRRLPPPEDLRSQARVQENQTLLRTFETVFNRLQADIDRKDAETAALKQRLKESEAVNSKLTRKLKSNCLPTVDKVEPLLSVGLFDSVVKDCCRSMHRLSKLLIRLTNKSGWDFDSGVDLIYPDVCYAKPGHKRYAILSYICLGMFDGFDSDTFCSEECEIDLNLSDGSDQRRNSLRQFIQNLAVDPLESVRRNPDCGFARFCKSKYVQLISKCTESSIFGNLDSSLGSLEPANPLYQLFVDMASSLWSLHKLAHAYDPEVEIFQVERGTEFSMVFMENIVRSADYRRAIPAKVGFTVVPGFRVGKTTIQCRVYLDGVKEAL
ncbi:uncharacterized protein LOC109825362 [Asparagus officinalis]|nr:uncharacterized protein LOC109825362 [Asparagus officinalis]